MDVRAGSIPLQNCPRLITDGLRTGTKPAVRPILPQHAVFGLIVIAGFGRLLPLRQGPVPVFRMHIVEPREAIGRAGSRSCVFVEAVADVVPRTICLAAE